MGWIPEGINYSNVDATLQKLGTKSGKCVD
jgi:hypothetical protein